jgi:VIT1/CCC1 family predicted Fe2+/Mn2+ transporter
MKKSINKYLSSIILGLNDALVELLGVLAGFTIALENTRMIALTGLITGIAASFSMGASEFLSNDAQEETRNNALMSSFATFTSYIVTVCALILPYFVLENAQNALFFTTIIAIFIIIVFSYIIAHSQKKSFLTQVTKMLSLSIGIALFSFFIAHVLKTCIL